MTLRIDYTSHAFPASYTFPGSPLQTSWNDLLWAAITIGRPSTYHVFRYGPASFHEAIFRLSLVFMALEQDKHNYLRRTDAYVALDPTEKGMVSYFLGMTLCKTFASRLLDTPWLLHLDVFRQTLKPQTFGRSRPDLVGEDTNGEWHAFESKGRSSVPSATDRSKAKVQAQRLVSVAGQNCALHVASFAYFRSNVLAFDWQDPDTDSGDGIELPRPEAEWRFYFEPALALASELDSEAMVAELALADVRVEIHPKIHRLLLREQWLQAKQMADDLYEVLIEQGYKPDGIRVTAGDSWSSPYDSRRVR